MKVYSCSRQKVFKMARPNANQATAILGGFEILRQTSCISDIWPGWRKVGKRPPISSDPTIALPPMSLTEPCP